MAALSLVAALYLRIGNDIVAYEPRLTATYIVGFTLIAAGVFLLTGLYRGIWRYASLPDLFNIARAVTLTVAVFLAGDVRVHPARGVAPLDLADRLVRADRAVGRPAPRLSAVQGPRPRPRPRARQGTECAGSADQRQGRRRHLYSRDAARPPCGLSGRRGAFRHSISGRPGDLSGPGARHDRCARRCRRPPRPSWEAAAKADHHRAEPAGGAGQATARTRRRFGDSARAPAEADRFPRNLDNPERRSNRSRSKICSAGRRRCSTATAWRA